MQKEKQKVWKRFPWWDSSSFYEEIAKIGISWFVKEIEKRAGDPILVPQALESGRVHYVVRQFPLRPEGGAISPDRQPQGGGVCSRRSSPRGSHVFHSGSGTRRKPGPDSVYQPTHHCLITEQVFPPSTAPPACPWKNTSVLQASKPTSRFQLITSHSSLPPPPSPRQHWTPPFPNSKGEASLRACWSLILKCHHNDRTRSSTWWAQICPKALTTGSQMPSPVLSPTLTLNWEPLFLMQIPQWLLHSLTPAGPPSCDALSFFLTSTCQYPLPPFKV